MILMHKIACYQCATWYPLTSTQVAVYHNELDKESMDTHKYL